MIAALFNWHYLLGLWHSRRLSYPGRRGKVKVWELFLAHPV